MSAAVDLTPHKGETREDRAALDVLGVLRALDYALQGSEACDVCGCLCQPWEAVCPKCRPVLEVQP